jgi:predicted porin
MINRTVSVAAAALFALAPPTYAADLGGNCCADLDERVAELEATTARKGNRKVSLEVSGHVNAAFLYVSADDINERDIIDNENSESRVRFKGSAKINAQWSAGFLIELGLAEAVNGDGTPEVRHSALWLKVKNFGIMHLGQTSMESDGIMEIVTGHNAATASTLGSLAPFDSFVKRETGFGLDNPFDGTRKQVISFRSASLGGFRLGGSWADDDSYDVALRYAGEFGAFRIAGGVAFRHDEVEPDIGAAGSRRFKGGSASIMHTPSGLYLDGIYGESDGVQTGSFEVPIIGDVTFGIADQKVTIYGGRIGVHHKATALGKTNIFVEYQELEIHGTDIDPTLYGVGIVQNIDAAAMEIYASYRRIDLDLGSGSEVDTFLAGAKIRF